MHTTRKLMIATALSFGLFAAPAAMAERDQDRGSRHGDVRHDNRDHGRGADRHDDRNDNRRYDRRGHDRHERRDDRGHGHNTHRRDDAHRHWQGQRYHAPRYYAPRGYVRHNWRAGHYVPPAYRHSRYVVNDYRHYHLHQPPRGHHWVRVDSDVVLTAVATGVVAAVVYGIFQ